MIDDNEHRLAVKSIRNYYAPLIAHADSGGREYALVAVRSLITLNAGVAVAYPTIAELFLESLTTQEFLGPVAIAIFGAFLGIACSYAAYFNHGYTSGYAECQMELEILKANKQFDESTYFQLKKFRNKSEEHWVNYSEKYDKFRTVYFYVSNIMGGLSALCFAVSAIWFAINVAG